MQKRQKTRRVMQNRNASSEKCRHVGGGLVSWLSLTFNLPVIAKRVGASARPARSLIVRAQPGQSGLVDCLSLEIVDWRSFP